jgi:hypothetical protein
MRQDHVRQTNGNDMKLLNFALTEAIQCNHLDDSPCSEVLEKTSKVIGRAKWPSP